jgi:hypothetical protein
MYVIITVILAALIAGFGASFAFFCRLPELDRTGQPES